MSTLWSARHDIVAVRMHVGSRMHSSSSTIWDIHTPAPLGGLIVLLESVHVVSTTIHASDAVDAGSGLAQDLYSGCSI